MRHRFVALAGMPAVAALFLSTAFPAVAQTPKAPAKAFRPHRMPDGHPDLQGTYDIATITPMERPSGQPLALSPDSREPGAYGRQALLHPPTEAAVWAMSARHPELVQRISELNDPPLLPLISAYSP